MYSSSAINLRGHQGPQERRNAIINGDFNICQRGEFTVTPYEFLFGEGTGVTSDYTLDRWLYFQAGDLGIAGTQPQVTIERRGHEPDGPIGFTPLSNHFLRVQTSGTGASLSNLYNTVNIAKGVTSEAYLEQRIEDVKTLAGKSATLSFKGRFSTESGTSRVIGASLVQVLGTGGTDHSPDVVLEGTTFALGTDWAKYSHTFSIPDLMGSTFGMTGSATPTGMGDTAGSYLATRLYLQAGTGGTGSGLPIAPGVFGWNTGATEAIDLSQVQLEAGEQSTDFEQRSIGDEIRDCKRYFETIRSFVSTDGTVASAATSSTVIKMDEKRNKYWASKHVYGDWSNRDTNRGVDLLHADIDGFVLQVTSSSGTGNLIANLNSGHNPGGGDAGAAVANQVEGRIWVTVDSEL